MDKIKNPLKDSKYNKSKEITYAIPLQAEEGDSILIYPLKVHL
ncbi:MAG: hypothetical protein N2257_06570 [Thermodesulfovibrionales bacterium]|nr:hypothetical protein [Thermodesulfovibrionales bacterium]